MTVDFARLLDESRALDADRDTLITFEVTRGSFTIPRDLLAAIDDDETAAYELRRLFARSLPEHDPGDVVNTTRRRIVTHVQEL